MKTDSKDSAVDGYKKFLVLCDEEKETLRITQHNMEIAKAHMKRTFGQARGRSSSFEDALMSDIESSDVNVSEDLRNPEVDDIESQNAIKVAVGRFFEDFRIPYLSRIETQNKDYSHS